MLFNIFGVLTKESQYRLFRFFRAQKYRAAVALTICCCLSGIRDLFRNYDGNSNGNVPQIKKQTNRQTRKC